MSSRFSPPNACPWCAKTSSGVRVVMVVPFARSRPADSLPARRLGEGRCGPGGGAQVVLAYGADQGRPRGVVPARTGGLMKAVRLHRYEERPVVEGVAEPEAKGPYDVVVRVGGAGLCRTALHI